MTDDLIKIADKSALPSCGEVKEFFAGGRFLCVANVDGEISVMDNVCPHWGGPLGRGRIENGQLVCPWHGWTFNPKTGETPQKANTCVAVHKVTLEGDEVFVQFAPTSHAHAQNSLAPSRDVYRRASKAPPVNSAAK